MKRLTSRKFIVALIVQIAAITVLFWPDYDEQINQVAQNMTALIVLALTSMGYISAEASIDRTHQNDRSKK